MSNKWLVLTADLWFKNWLLNQPWDLFFISLKSYKLTVNYCYLSKFLMAGFELGSSGSAKCTSTPALNWWKLNSAFNPSPFCEYNSLDSIQNPHRRGCIAVRLVSCLTGWIQIAAHSNNNISLGQWLWLSW